MKVTKDVSDQYFEFESREFKELMEFVEIPRTRQEMQDFCGIANKDTLRRKVLNPLVNAKKIRLTIPEKPRSSKQMYQRY